MKIIIIGITCSGKTTLSNKMISKGANRLLEYTDRPMRGECEFNSYNFVNRATYKFMKDDGKLLSHNTFFNYSYGISTDDFYQWDSWVCVTNPRTILQLHNEGVLSDCFIIKLDPPMDIIRERIISDDRTPAYDIESRITNDLIDMSTISHIPMDLIITE